MNDIIVSGMDIRMGKSGQKELHKHHEALAKRHEALSKEHEATAATHEKKAK